LKGIIIGGLSISEEMSDLASIKIKIIICQKNEQGHKKRAEKEGFIHSFGILKIKNDPDTFLLNGRPLAKEESSQSPTAYVVHIRYSLP